jgi:hypothetical protein
VLLSHFLQILGDKNAYLYIIINVLRVFQGRLNSRWSGVGGLDAYEKTTANIGFIVAGWTENHSKRHGGIHPSQTMHHKSETLKSYLLTHTVQLMLVGGIGQLARQLINFAQLTQS